MSLTDSGDPEHQPRLARFQVQAPALVWPDENNPIRCISTGTRDISRSGLYLTASVDAAVGSAIRFEVQLPAPFGGETGCLLRGRGKVTRRQVEDDRCVGFAATIDRFEMCPLRKPAGKVEPEAELKKPRTSSSGTGSGAARSNSNV